MNLQSQSTQYLHVPVAATNAPSGTPYNPTADPVYFAFLVSGEPVSGTTWYTGAWDPGQPSTARILVGPANSGLVLAADTYNVWVKVTDNPEVPVMQAGTLTIY